MYTQLWNIEMFNAFWLHLHILYLCYIMTEGFKDFLIYKIMKTYTFPWLHIIIIITLALATLDGTVSNNT